MSGSGRLPRREDSALIGIFCTLLSLAATPVSPNPVVTGSAAEAEAANFIVISYLASQDAREVAAHCEAWKARLQTYWCGQVA
jgi:hypothetical protein